MVRFDAPRRSGMGVATALLLFAASGAARAGCPGCLYEPARYDAIAPQSILVAPARIVWRRIPPVVREVSERVLVRPEQRVPRQLPPVYRTVTERVVVQPGKTLTRYIPPIQDVARPGTPGAGTGLVQLRPAQSVVDTTPPTYALRTRTIVVQPARTQVQIVPAVYATRVRRIALSPARVVAETLPPRYRTVARRVLVQWAAAPVQAVSPDYYGEVVPLSVPQMSAAVGFCPYRGY